MSEETNRLTDNDHDVLVRLDTKFEHFTKQVDTLLAIMQEKADKSDIREVRSHVKDNSERIATLEGTHRDSDVRKQALLQIGKFGIDGWQLFVGAMMALLTIWQLIK